MVAQHDEQAADIVLAFRASLGDALSGQISAARFNELESAISQALSAERAMVIGKIESVVKKIRSEVDRPELGL